MHTASKEATKVKNEIGTSDLQVNARAHTTDTNICNLFLRIIKNKSDK